MAVGQRPWFRSYSLCDNNQGRAGHKPVRAMQTFIELVEPFFEMLPSPVFFNDDQGRFKACNRMFAQMILGLDKKDIKGKTMFDLPQSIPEDKARFYHVHDMDLFMRGGTQIYEADVKCADGRVRPFLFMKKVIHKSGVDHDGIISVMQDLSDQRLAEANAKAETAALAVFVIERCRKMSIAVERAGTAMKPSGFGESGPDPLDEIKTEIDNLVRVMNAGLAAKPK